MTAGPDAPEGEYDALRCEGTGVTVRHVVGSPAWSLGAGALRRFEAGAGPHTLRAVSEQGDVLWLDARDGGLRRRVRLPYAYTSERYAAALGPGVAEAHFSPGGALLAVQFRSGRLALCDAATAQPGVQLSPDPRVAGQSYALAGFSPDGALVAAQRSLAIRRGETPARTLLWSADGGPAGELDGGGCLAWADDGDLFVARERGGGAGDVVRVGRGGSARWVCSAPPLFGLGLAVSADGSLVFAYGGETIAGVLDFGTPMRSVLRALDAKTGAVRWQLGFLQRPQALRVGARGGALWLVDRDGLRAVDPATGEPVAEVSWADEPPERRGGAHFALSDDEQTLYVPMGPRVARFDAATGEERSEGAGVRGALRVVALSLSGSTVATTDQSRAVRVHSAESGDEVWGLDAPDAGALAMSFSPDERALYSLTAVRGAAFDLADGMVSRSVWSSTPSVGPARSADPNALNTLRRAAVAPDGSALYALGEAMRVGTAALNAVPLVTDGPARTARLPCRPQALLDARFAADGRALLVTLSSGALLSVDPSTLAVEDLGALGGGASDGLVPVAFLARDRESMWALAPDGGSRAEPSLALYTRVRGPSPVRFEAPAEFGAPAGHLDASADGRWLLTGTLAGDALVWRVEAGPDGARARCAARVALSLAHDRLAGSSFDARGETLALGTERGVLVVCALAPG